MALRKNNQKDYEKFANPNIDVLGNEKNPPKIRHFKKSGYIRIPCRRTFRRRRFRRSL